MVSDIMNLHESKEILTLSQHHETHDNPETQSQKYVTNLQSEPHIPLALLHHMPFCDIMKPLHRSTPRSPGNYCEFNPNQVSSPKGEGSPKTTKLGNRTTQGCYRIPLFAPACRPARAATCFRAAATPEKLDSANQRTMDQS